jgi:hypothetical protein
MLCANTLNPVTGTGQASTSRSKSAATSGLITEEQRPGYLWIARAKRNPTTTEYVGQPTAPGQRLDASPLPHGDCWACRGNETTLTARDRQNASGRVSTKK